MVIPCVIVAIAIFFVLNNQSKNRTIERRNRLAEKQEELIEMLREKNNKEIENKENEN